MLHQIFMYSDKVKLAAGQNNDTPHPPPLPHHLPSYWINEQTNKEVHISNLNRRQIFPCQYIHVIYIHCQHFGIHIKLVVDINQILTGHTACML